MDYKTQPRKRVNCNRSFTITASLLDMPAIATGKVLVTGANGYLGTWLVRTLIEHGYHVRGTVRDSSKGEGVRKALDGLSKAFEYVVVSDVLEVSLRFLQCVTPFDDHLGFRETRLTMPLMAWTSSCIRCRPSS